MKWINVGIDCLSIDPVLSIHCHSNIVLKESDAFKQEDLLCIGYCIPKKHNVSSTIVFFYVCTLLNVIYLLMFSKEEKHLCSKNHIH